MSRKELCLLTTRKTLEKVCLETLLILKERICSYREQILSLISSLYGKEIKKFMLMSLYWKYFLRILRTCVMREMSATPMILLLTRNVNFTLVLLNKLRCHALFKFSASQIPWSRLLIYIHILNGTTVQIQISWLLRSQLVWIYTVCKGRVYPGSAGRGLR